MERDLSLVGVDLDLHGVDFAPLLKVVVQSHASCAEEPGGHMQVVVLEFRRTLRDRVKGHALYAGLRDREDGARFYDRGSAAGDLGQLVLCVELLLQRDGRLRQ